MRWLTLTADNPQIHRESAIRTAVEMGLFNTLITVPDTGITAQDLAEKTNSDEVFISRHQLTPKETLSNGA